MSNFNHLLGRYNDTFVKEGDNTIIYDVVRIDGTVAYTSQGITIPIEQLGTRYEKLEPEWMNPKHFDEIMAGMPSDVRSQAHKIKALKENQKEQKLPTLNQPSSKPIQEKEVVQEVPKNSENLPWLTNAPAPTTELEKLIVSSMKLGYKKQESSELAVSISLKFNFDIEKIVAGASMMTGATDKEILEAFFKYCPVNTEDVKNAIINELMQPIEETKD